MRILFAMYFIPPLVVFMGIAVFTMFKGKRKKVKKSADDE
jgi:preprotein translocase subunit YajC